MENEVKTGPIGENLSTENIKTFEQGNVNDNFNDEKEQEVKEEVNKKPDNKARDAQKIQWKEIQKKPEIKKSEQQLAEQSEKLKKNGGEGAGKSLIVGALLMGALTFLSVPQNAVFIFAPFGLIFGLFSYFFTTKKNATIVLVLVFLASVFNMFFK